MLSFSRPTFLPSQQSSCSYDDWKDSYWNMAEVCKGLVSLGSERTMWLHRWVRPGKINQNIWLWFKIHLKSKACKSIRCTCEVPTLQIFYVQWHDQLSSWGYHQASNIHWQICFDSRVECDAQNSQHNTQRSSWLPGKGAKGVSIKNEKLKYTTWIVCKF